MAELLSFLIIIGAGLFLSEFFKKFNVPYVVALILAGMLIGPFGYQLFAPDQTIEFLGEIGLVFLMFMAGLETKFSSFGRLRNGVGVISILNSTIPFLVGLGLALFLGYDMLTSLFVGTIFISSSIAIIIPSLEANGMLKSKLGKTILSATIVEDMLSLVVFSLLLHSINPISDIPLPIFFLFVIFFAVFLRAFIIELRKIFFTGRKKGVFEAELRFTLLVLLGTVFFFEILGLHPIIAGFFAGMTLSESIRTKTFREKLHGISYGIFIPIFFILIGTKTDLGALVNSGGAIIVIVLLVVGSIISKFASGFFAGRLTGFDPEQSKLIGASTIPQLSTTLAVAFTGFELGVLDQKLMLALTVLSIVTTFVGPILIKALQPKV